VRVCKDNASQENIANFFCHLWVELISLAVLERFRAKQKVSIYHYPRFNANIGDE
jgi:hypothetical protein